MPERDTPLDIDELPIMQADKRTDDSIEGAQDSEITENKGAVKTIKAPRSISAIWPAIAVLILCIVGLSVWNSALVEKSRQQQDDLLDAFQRLSLLEESVSSTGESMTQSSVVMQIRLKEIEKNTQELTTQMDKLWASAWRRNQTEIAAHGKQIEALEKQRQEQASQLESLTSEFTAEQKTIRQLKAENTLLAKNIKVFTAKEKEWLDLKKQLIAQAAANKALKAQVEENIQWQKSNNAFRQQTNKNFARIEKEMAAKHATATSAAPVE